MKSHYSSIYKLKKEQIKEDKNMQNQQRLKDALETKVVLKFEELLA